MAFHAYRTLSCGVCHHTITVPICCHDRFCPVCSSTRRSRVRARLHQLVSYAHKQSANSIRHVTLTLVSDDDPSRMASELVAAFTRLRARHWWRRHCTGGAYVIEVKRNGSFWHVHCHTLVQGIFIPQSELSTEWHKVSGSFVVWVTRPDKTKIAAYLTKYLSKPADCPEDVSTVSAALRSFRLFQPFGSWHKIALPRAKPICPCQNCGAVAWYVLPYSTEIIEFCSTGPPIQTASG